MSLTPVRMPESAVPQFWGDMTHATVIVIVVIAATVLRAMQVLDVNTTGNVYTAAVGYAAGRAGSVAHRAFTTRQDGSTQARGDVDATG